MYWAMSLRDSQISSIAGTADSARRQLAKLRELQTTQSVYRRAWHSRSC
jgi:hypothetical protein